jgi:hypothetical protein
MFKGKMFFLIGLCFFSFQNAFSNDLSELKKALSSYRRNKLVNYDCLHETLEPLKKFLEETADLSSFKGHEKELRTIAQGFFFILLFHSNKNLSRFLLSEDQKSVLNDFLKKASVFLNDSLQITLEI